MSVTTFLDMQFKPEKADEALAAFQKILKDTRAFDGCESLTIFQDHTNPAHVIVVEQWASLEHDTAYRTWRAGEGQTPELAEFVAGMPSMTISRHLTDL